MQIPARLAAFKVNNDERFGLVRDDGVVDLTDNFRDKFADLQAAVVAGALEELVAAGESGTVTYSMDDIEFLIPIVLQDISRT